MREFLGQRSPLALPDHLGEPIGRVAPERRLGQLELPVQVEGLQSRAGLQQIARLELSVNDLVRLHVALESQLLQQFHLKLLARH